MRKKKDDRWTTLRVEKATREIINSLAEERGLTVNDFLKGMAKGSARSFMQVLMNFKPEKYHVLDEVTRILHQSGAIPRPTVDSTIDFAIDSLIQGITKNLESQNAPRQGTNAT